MKKQIKKLKRRFHRWVERRRNQLALRIKKNREALREQVAEIKLGGSSKSFRMFDSIELDEFPNDPEAVAGYVNGYWPTFNALLKEFPKAKHLSIAVTSSANAECLDVEPGDATPADAPGWLKRQKDRGVDKPVIYVMLSQAQALVDLLDRAGYDRSEYRLWIAHYAYEPHLCDSRCGFGLKTKADATQFTDKSGGRNLDESLCRAGFLDK